MKNKLKIASPPRLAYSVADMSERTGISERSIREMASDGRLQVVRPGRKIIISARALDEFLSGRCQTPEAILAGEAVNHEAANQ